MQCYALFLLKQFRKCEIQEGLLCRASDRYLGGNFTFRLMAFQEIKPEFSVLLS